MRAAPSCARIAKSRSKTGRARQKAEPVLKPSEALKPKSLEIASPITDHFYVRGTYFQGDVTTVMRIDSTGATTPDGTLLSGEDDLGLDDVVNQGRMEFDIRMGERNHVRIDYFKLNRFSEVIAAATTIDFGDFDFRRRRPTSAPSSTGACCRSPTRIRSSRPTASKAASGSASTSSKRRPRVASPARSIDEEDTEVGHLPDRSPPTSRTAFPSAGRSPRAHSSLRLIADDCRRHDARIPTPTCSFAGARISRSASATAGCASISTCIDADEPSCSTSRRSGPEAFFRVSF